ncbi:MAG: arsenosugar biosynthesis radical SAM protein ArsS [Deltaproteobacteria bacterium]|nr:arsenosugar biosynthesis radical SAM protein ArsS [Deltaproteobacteria bacterium]
MTETGLTLVRGDTTTLQINMGLLCNQACRHCHLEAGPQRREIMSAGTVEELIAYSRRGNFLTADITGGAPELNPHLIRLIDGLAPQVKRIMVRSNLTALTDGPQTSLLEFFKERRVVVIASFPSLQPAQTDSQRGSGVFQNSLDSLRRLNALGYGREGGDLELNLVSNPGGAFLPPAQEEAEKRFRRELKTRWGLSFNHLYVFANVPLGRYRNWLDQSGNLESYQQKLVSCFNPAALGGVMCRYQISVSWEGLLYDCDFNLALDLPYGGRKVHVSAMDGPPPIGTPIQIGDHCYACTAGRGFSCGGAICA